MTKEEAKAEIRKVFEPAFANYIITALTEGATPSERKTGKWIPSYGNVKCSVCGTVRDCREVGKATHFCPHCGAKMEGAAE